MDAFALELKKKEKKISISMPNLERERFLYKKDVQPLASPATIQVRHGKEHALVLFPQESIPTESFSTPYWQM